MSKVKLEQLLARRLQLKEPEFKLERIGTKVAGSIISPTFRRKSDYRRQAMIWAALEAELGWAAVREVGTLLAYTPEEWNVDLPTEAGTGSWARVKTISKLKLQQLLSKRLKLQSPVFKLERIGTSVAGSIISPRFRRKSDRTRLKMIWAALDAELGEACVKQVGMLLVYTPEEWDMPVAVG
jgi:acid stress-induced BolA-like protein IbaG/YrbA